MAFCNACGATVETGAKFCPKCGGAVPATVVSSTPPAPVPQAQGGGGAVKIILIVVAIIVGLGIIGTVAATWVGLSIARHTRVEQNGNNVKVQTPFGTVTSTDNSEDAAKNLGIDAYPNAHVLKGNAANVSVGGMHSVAAEFETDDPPEKVAEFYKSKLPHVTVSSVEGKQYNLVSTDNNSLITVTIQEQDGKTHIHVANVSGKPEDKQKD